MKSSVAGIFTLVLSAMISAQFRAAEQVSALSDVNFKGKTVRIVIGTSTGGGMDLWARLIAQYLGRYMPGEPSLVVQTCPARTRVPCPLPQTGEGERVTRAT